MMKAYIAVSNSQKAKLSSELKAITAGLTKVKVDGFVFVNNYNFTIADEREMMLQAIADIDHCDILIAETSYKGIGIGIEVGYAKAKRKPIIYLRHKNAEHSTTVSGISDFQLIYENIADLQNRLADIVSKAISSTKKNEVSSASDK